MRPCALWSVPDCLVKCLNTRGCWGVEVRPDSTMALVAASCASKHEEDVGYQLHLLRPEAPLSHRSRLHRRTFPHIFPQPTRATNGSTPVLIDLLNFKFEMDEASAASANDPVLREAFRRTKSTLFPDQRSQSQPQAGETPAHERHVAGVSTVRVLVRSSDTTLQLGTSEAYELEIDPTGAVRIVADTVYGVVRGLDTFSQLVTYSASANRFVIHGCPWLIQDAPRFKHRGLLIDSGRYLSACCHTSMNGVQARALASVYRDFYLPAQCRLLKLRSAALHESAHAMPVDGETAALGYTSMLVHRSTSVDLARKTFPLSPSKALYPARHAPSTDRLDGVRQTEHTSLAYLRL